MGANDSATSGNKATALHRETETRMVIVVGYYKPVCFSSFGSRFTSRNYGLVEVGASWRHRASFSILRHYEAARPSLNGAESMLLLVLVVVSSR